MGFLVLHVVTRFVSLFIFLHSSSSLIWGRPLLLLLYTFFHISLDNNKIRLCDSPSSPCAALSLSARADRKRNGSSHVAFAIQFDSPPLRKKMSKSFFFHPPTLLFLWIQSEMKRTKRRIASDELKATGGPRRNFPKFQQLFFLLLS